MNNYTAMDIANYIIWYANQSFSNDVYLSPLKLHKILYYVQATFLANFDGQPLFNDVIEKWQYGPVVRDVYFEFKSHGTDHIQSTHSVLSMIESDNGMPAFELLEFNENKIEAEAKVATLIKNVVDKLISKSPFELVEQTHQEPMWANDKVRILAGERSLTYDNIEITKYFKKHPVI